LSFRKCPSRHSDLQNRRFELREAAFALLPARNCRAQARTFRSRLPSSAVPLAPPHSLRRTRRRPPPFSAPLSAQSSRGAWPPRLVLVSPQPEVALEEER